MSEPIIKMDSKGVASIISYNVPEPTSYAGRNIIELEFEDTIFTDLAKIVPENRQQQLSKADLEAAVDTAAETGVVNDAIFPNATRRTMTRPAMRSSAVGPRRG